MAYFYNDPRDDPERDSSYDNDEATAGRMTTAEYAAFQAAGERYRIAARLEFESEQRWLAARRARPAAEKLAELVSGREKLIARMSAEARTNETYRAKATANVLAAQNALTSLVVKNPSRPTKAEFTARRRAQDAVRAAQESLDAINSSEAVRRKDMQHDIASYDAKIANFDD